MISPTVFKMLRIIIISGTDTAESFVATDWMVMISLFSIVMLQKVRYIIKYEKIFQKCMGM